MNGKGDIAATAARAVDRGPLPLVVGVTGHRDLRPQDRDGLRARVRDVLQRLTEECPHTPLVLLSPLAEGADRLVAEVALALDPPAQLVVPLPLPLDLYVEDFTESKDEFDGLLARAVFEDGTPARFELPMLDERNADAVARPGAARDDQYAQVGAFIARNCHVLLALWNGRPSDKSGGTADVVAWKREHIPLRFVTSPLNASESWPVIQIVTPRQSQTDTPGDAFQEKLLLPVAGTSEGMDKAFERIRSQVERFNRDCLRPPRKVVARLRRNQEEVLPEAALATVPEERRAGVRALREAYGHADALALHCQGWTFGILAVLHVMAFTAILSFEVYAHLHPVWWLGAAFPVLMWLAIRVFRRAQRYEWEQRYQDYRALAEGLRVQLVWTLCLGRISAADHYLGVQRNELDWIRQALRAWTLLAEVRANGAGPPTRAQLQLAHEHWILGQQGFFERKAPAMKSKAHGLETLRRWVVRAGLAIAVAGSVIHLLSDVDFQAHHGLHWCVVLVATLLVIGGLSHHYLELRAFGVHANRYAWTRNLFAKAARLFESHADDDQVKRDIVFDLGKEALAENAEWLLVHRERPMDVPS